MVEHSILQGSDEWHIFRLDHFGASEAAAMLGLSSKVTRNQLLHAKKTGIARAFSDWLQENVLDKGKDAEASALHVVEDFIGKRLFPVTCSNGILSASCDGITRDGTIAWENKLWNARQAHEIASTCTVPAEHMPQCQQILMVTGAERLIFTMSDGTKEKTLYVMVNPDQQWFETLSNGWAQFQKDLTDFEPFIYPEKPIADAVTELPALFVQAKGEITSSNMVEFGKHLALSLENTRNIALLTDQDYANAEATAKLYRETCKRLMLVKDAVLAQATTIGEATRLIDEWHEDLRVTALQLEQNVKKKKDSDKLAIIQQAKQDFFNHVSALEDAIRPIRLNLPLPDFAGAISGKRLVSAWQNAADTLLANSIIAADTLAKDIGNKLAWYVEESVGYEFLFKDLDKLIIKPIDDFQLVVMTRIKYQKTVEADKLKAERELMRIEEEAKARVKIETETRAKLALEAVAQRAADERKEPPKLELVQNEPQQPAIEDVVRMVPSATPGQFEYVPPDESEPETYVTITQAEYDELLADSAFLACLQEAGVDNWDGYEAAQEMFESEYGETANALC